MEYLEKFLKKTGWSSLLSSVVFAILGIILIVNPEGTVKLISGILGTMFILIGLYKLATYFANREDNNFYDLNLAYGIIAVILGIVTIVYTREIGSIFRILIGIWIIYSSITRMNLSVRLKAIDSKVWLYSLIIALAMFICGLYIIFTANVIIITIGTIILIYSILDIIESVLFLNNVSKL